MGSNQPGADVPDVQPVSLTKKERKRLKDRERMDRYIALVRRSNLTLLHEMEAEEYLDFDVTVEDATTCSNNFLTWGAFHKTQCFAAAALLSREDPEFVLEFCQLGLQKGFQILMQEEEEAAGGGEREDVWFAFGGLAASEDVGLEVEIKPQTSFYSNIILERKGGRAHAEVRAALEAEKRMGFLFALGQHPLITDQTKQDQWGACREFFSTAHRTVGLMVTNHDEEVANDSADHAPINLAFCGRRHSRFCEVANYPNKGTLVLGLVMQRSEEIFRQVTAMANMKTCSCLTMFRDEKFVEVDVKLKLTLKVGLAPQKSWETKAWFTSYVIGLSNKIKISWWVRVWTLYQMLRGVTTWQDIPQRVLLEIHDPILVQADRRKLFIG